MGSERKYQAAAQQILDVLGLPLKRAYALAEKFHGDVAAAIDWGFNNQHQLATLEPSAEFAGSAATAKPPSSNSDPDAEFKKAIALSLQSVGGSAGASTGGAANGASQEEIELQRAIEASTRTGVIDLTNDSTAGIAGEDANLQAAMLASIQGTDKGTLGMISNDPVARQRESHLPVGLKNVGNTCYLNSLLQTYFMMPQIRQRVLTADLDAAAVAAAAAAIAPAALQSDAAKTDASNQENVAPSSQSSAPAGASVAAANDNIAFMKELQRMYSYLIASQEKFFDPSKFFKSLVDEQGHPVRIGTQEDVGEFNDLFIHRMSKALELASGGSAEGAEKFLKDMFSTDAVEVLVCEEADGSKKESEKEIDVGRHFILPVGKGIRDLHSAMDHFMCDVLNDFRTESGHSAQAHKYKWFRKLPTIIMFQENRVHFDQGFERKCNDPLKFDDLIYMDRYMYENKEISLERREDVNRWRDELTQLEEKLAAILNFEASGLNLDKLLGHAASYMNLRKAHLQEGEDPAPVDAAFQFLQLCAQQESSNKKKLEDDIVALQKRIDSKFDDLKKVPYRLFGVWVHAGGSGSGHYWAHIRDIKSGGRWVRFNDIHCSVVTEEDVFKDATGGPGNTSAYFLIYMSEDEFNKNSAAVSADGAPIVPQVAPIALIPEPWRKEVDEVNSKFLKEVEEQTKNSTDKRVERFITSFQSKLRAAVEVANNYSLAQDMRVRNFPAFMLSLGYIEDAQSFLIKEHWVYEFSRGVEKDIDSSAFQLACAKLAHLGGEPLMRRAIDSVYNNRSEEDLKKQHAEFKKIFQFYSTAVNCMTDRKYVDALRNLTVAERRNRELGNQLQMIYRRDILAMLQLCCLATFDEVMNAPAANVALCKDLIAAVRYSFQDEDPFMVYFRQKFFDSTLSGDDLNSESAAAAMATIAEYGEILIADAPDKAPFTLPEPKPYDEPEQWEALVTRTKDAISRAKKDVDAYEKELSTVLERDPFWPTDAKPSPVAIVGLEAANSNSNISKDSQASHVMPLMITNGPVNSNNYDISYHHNSKLADAMEVD